MDQAKEKEYPFPSTSMDKKSTPTGSSGSVDSIGTRNVVVTVISHSGTKVQLMLKAFGLKKKKGMLNSIVTHFKKPGSPSKLLLNGQFTNFDLTSSSLRFTLNVQTDKKKKKGNANRVDTFNIDIKQFPSSVNAESAEFEVLEPASGECFILLTLKVDNINCNWKEFMAEHGTIDASTL
ncbi:hypothetical protein PENTCL1PPCAC_7688 [Pristionchus entomophagus]|uniref:Ubiquitin-like domain-containing protein n=1 Tax=Pristionchus entomophagus TaxID=358040 RepID=A0AAV5SY18_9BILA|nr:hypothetical protein PENTCL1PPCAC_7688 [Pristionchus entomophagus]